MSKIKLLIIENQKSQFLHICKNINTFGKGDFVVFPETISDNPDDKGEYETFMDNVRVALNTRYNDVKINIAKKNIISYIKEQDINLIIMDHNLVGWHKAQDGIDLAYFIVEYSDEEKKKLDIPILFLSRTPLNSIKTNLLPVYSDIKEKFDSIKSVEKDWVEKGYAGGALLEENYFKKNIIGKIRDLINRQMVFSAELKEKKVKKDLAHYRESDNHKYEELETIYTDIYDNINKLNKDQRVELDNLIKEFSNIKIEKAILRMKNIQNYYTKK